MRPSAGRLSLPVPSLVGGVSVRRSRDPRSGRASSNHRGRRRNIPMIIVHHLNNSRSQRVLWLLEELGLEYEVKGYQGDAKTMLAPPFLRAVPPLGNFP